MNWEAIGALAEGLGALGVIVTVVYLALQIRHNSESVRGATEHELICQEMALAALMSEHANVYRRGEKGLDQLDADEAVIFEWLVIATMSQLYSAFAQFKRGLIPESTWHAYLSDWPGYLEQPGFQQQWAQLEGSYPADFRRSLNEIASGTS